MALRRCAKASEGLSWRCRRQTHRAPPTRFVVPRESTFRGGSGGGGGRGLRESELCEITTLMFCGLELRLHWRAVAQGEALVLMFIALYLAAGVFQLLSGFVCLSTHPPMCQWSSDCCKACQKRPFSEN